jgi:hypothetical protein
MNKYQKKSNFSSLMPEDDDPEIFKKPKNERAFARQTEKMKRLRREAIEDREDY